MDHRGVAMEPLIKRVRVGLSREDAFLLFTRDMGSWWPLQSHSVAVDSYERKVTAEGLIFEMHVGGPIYESLSDGTRAAWGEILVWEPPDRVVFSWKPNLSDGPYTEVEVRFTASGSGTEVELEHRGWERFGDEGAARRDDYDTGWPRVLDLFAKAAEPLRS